MYATKKNYTTPKHFSCFGLSLSSHSASILLWNPSIPKGVWRFPTSLLSFKGSHNHKKIDLREGGENLCMLKQSPTCQLSPLLCTLKKYLTSYKGNKFLMEGDVVSNSVCASLASSELAMPWAQWSLLCYTKSQSWTRLTPWHPWFLPSHAFPKQSFKNAALVAEKMVSQQQLDCDRNVSL